MSGTVSSSLQITAQQYLYLDRDREFADDLYNLEKDHTILRAQKIRLWAENTEKLREVGLYPGPKESISTYLRQTMRLKGWNKYQLAYIPECLPPEFKDSSFDHRSVIPNDDEEEENSLFSQYAQAARGINFASQLERYSTAEQIEIILEGEKQDKEERKRIAERQKMRREFNQNHNLHIEELEKESAETPPEKFWRYNEVCKWLDNIAEKLRRVADRAERTAELFKMFAPTPEVAQMVGARMQDYVTAHVDVVMAAIDQTLDLWDNILLHYDDKKYCEDLPAWIKISVDQLENAGSHGSGKINAVQTGLYPIFISKDGKNVKITPIERPFTREIVGDQTGIISGPYKKETLLKMQTKLQKKALNIIVQNELASALSFASHNTEIVEEGIPVLEFYKKEMQRRRRQG